MKLTTKNDRFALKVTWRNAVLPNPERGQVEAAYGRSMKASADGSIDKLRDIHAAACRDCGNQGPAYHVWMKMDSVARANAFSNIKILAAEKKHAAFGLDFEVEND